jgi:hypothetical protein
METIPQNAAPLSPDVFLRGWQQAGSRMLRAQERLLHGVASAAKLEMRFGQELMESRLALLKWAETDSQTNAARTAQEVEKLMVMMHGVTKELRTGFADAAKLLAELPAEAPPESAPAVEVPEIKEPPVKVPEIKEPEEE